MSLILFGLQLLSAPAAATEITLWHAWRGEERAVLEELTSEYQSAHPGDQIELVSVPYESLASKLEAAVPRGNGPDLFIFAHERLGDWVKTALIQPVGPAADYTDAAHGALAGDDSLLYGWPLATKCLALFYNRALVPVPPETTDDLLRLADQLRDHPTEPTRWGFAWEATSAYHNAPFMHGFGGGALVDGRAQLDRPENRAAFAFIQQLAALGPAETSGALITQLFNSGKVAMVPNGPWFLGEIEPQERGGPDFAVAPLPRVSSTGLPAAPYLTVEALFLAGRPAPSTREADGLARDFAAYLQRPDIAGRRAAEGKQVVPGAGGAPAALPDDPVLAAFQRQADLAVPMPTVPAMAQTWEPLARALRRLVRGAATPEQAAAEAQTTWLVVSRPEAPTVDGRPFAWLLGLGLALGAAWAVRQMYVANVVKAWREYLWVAPGGLAVVLLVVAPFVVGASVSLFEVSGSASDGTWRFVGFAHFTDILLSRDFPLTDASTRALSFWYTLAVTLIWTLTNVVLHVSLGVFLALMLREPWVKVRGVFRALLILPWAVPNYITALAWKGMFHQQFGAINALLGICGIAPVSWFAQWTTAFAANVATNTWLGFPFMMVVTLGALQSVSREVEEAAELDGATGWQKFWLVTLPMLKPALLPAVILGSVWTFNMFNVIFLVSGGEPDGSTDILVSQAYRWAFTRGHRYGYGAAYAVIIFGVMVVQSRLLNRVAGRKVL
ncbi:MAG: extracellular solute-binding protein [Myxococcales bacterium]|nr:extracellular solute-binding protein [Myxococcales bacterium]